MLVGWLRGWAVCGTSRVLALDGSHWTQLLYIRLWAVFLSVSLVHLFREMKILKVCLAVLTKCYVWFALHGTNTGQNRLLWKWAEQGGGSQPDVWGWVLLPELLRELPRSAWQLAQLEGTVLKMDCRRGRVLDVKYSCFFFRLSSITVWKRKLISNVYEIWPCSFLIFSIK